MPKKLYTAKFKQAFIESWSRSTLTFSDHCLRFGVTRETGYAWLERVRDGGFDALEPRSSAPHACPHATPHEIVELVIAARKLHPTWGPRKLGPWLLERHPNLELPAPSTMGEILKRGGLVAQRRRRSRVSRFTQPFSAVEAPNDVWTTDFKGQFRTRDGLHCYPLTLCDAHSRYLLRCDAYLSPDASVKKSFESAFIEYGLPRAIRSDNGTPFASVISPGGLSKLSVWWVKLGITPERITPASPWENGRHERMHRTLKAEATRPPQSNRASQQRTFNMFREEYNQERPHESLGQKPPASAYNSSARSYPKKLVEMEYDNDFVLRRVTCMGAFSWGGRKVFASTSLAGEMLGLRAASDRTWEVFFGPILLGTIDDEHPTSHITRPKLE